MHLISVTLFRSSRPKVFCKKGVLRNFAKFTGKHLCQSLFFNKVEGLRPATLLKKRLWHRRFRVNFAKFLRTPFIIEHKMVKAGNKFKKAKRNLFFVLPNANMPHID